MCERERERRGQDKQSEGGRKEREVPYSLSSVQWLLLIGCGFAVAVAAAVEQFSSFAVVWHSLQCFS